MSDYGFTVGTSGVDAEDRIINWERADKGNMTLIPAVLHERLPAILMATQPARQTSYIDEPVTREEPGTSEKPYCHRNQQYSIVALTTSAAGIVERYAYSAYGEPVFATDAGVVLTDSAKDNRYTYTGREWDEGLGLYHFRLRVSGGRVGTFLQRDPF